MSTPASDSTPNPNDLYKVIDNADDTYRWYLCTQTRPLGWTCVRTTAAELFSPYSSITSDSSIQGSDTTTMVNVYKFIPSVFDNTIVKHKMRSLISVKLRT